MVLAANQTAGPAQVNNHRVNQTNVLDSENGGLKDETTIKYTFDGNSHSLLQNDVYNAANSIPTDTD